MKKKIITITMSLIFVFALVGCGNKATGNGTPVAGGADMPNNSNVVDTERTQEAITTDCEAFNPNTPDYGLQVTAKDVTNKGLTLEFKQSGGNPTGILQTGSDYSIEKKTDGYWGVVKTIIEENEICWEDIAYEIPNDGMFVMGIDWSNIYGELESGTYRIRKPFMDFRGTGDFDGDSVYVEFVIE